MDLMILNSATIETFSYLGFGLGPASRRSGAGWYKGAFSKSENCLSSNFASPACLSKKNRHDDDDDDEHDEETQEDAEDDDDEDEKEEAADAAVAAPISNSTKPEPLFEPSSSLRRDDDTTTINTTTTTTTATITARRTRMSLLMNNRSRESLKLSGSVGYQLDAKNAAADCTCNLDQLIDISNSKSPWDILCRLINCKVAFKKQFNGKKYTWVQLAGHPGRFKPGDREGFILKLMDELERKSFERLKSDVLSPFVPAIDRVVYDMNDGNYYTEMQDLLYSFNNPSIMDIKIGVRTFIIDESDEKETMPRHDLYLKMKKIAPHELTEEENQRQAINKRRYMSWRECSTCSSTLGFRIEAIKKNQVSEKEFYNIKEKRDVQAHIRSYTNNKKYILHMYKNRLLRLRETLLQSDFFYNHEMIGSSLLFVHDDRKANIWMIDFGKTRPLPEGVRLSHDVKWQEGNYEDGYLIGIDSLIDIFNDALNN